VLATWESSLGRPDQRLPRRDAFGAAGYTTRHDLSALARYLFLALIALVLFGIVAIFVQIPAASSSTRSSRTRARTPMSLLSGENRLTGTGSHPASQLMLIAAGMVAVVNGVVIAAFVGLVLEAAGVQWLAVQLGCGAAIGAGAFVLHERHHRRALIAYRVRGSRSGRDLPPTIARGRPVLKAPVHESEEHHRSIEACP
jgi:hypothetical protein